MPMGAKTMTFECGMRFLTDYLQEINISGYTEKVIILTDAVPSSSLLKIWNKSGIL